MAERLCRCVDFINGELPPFVARVEDSTAERLALWRRGAAGGEAAAALGACARRVARCAA